MNPFNPGQCWINYAEPELGIGIVQSSAGRTVNITFPVCAEQRTYAIESAPLTRVKFSIGDPIRSADGTEIHITAIEQDNALISYTGTDRQQQPHTIIEADLDPYLQLSRPGDRLFSGQVDDSKWFELRRQARLHSDRLLHSEYRGLGGGRTSLIPHQLYVAHEVAKRYAPRVLLADEVGLGKTIEAGMIIHQQLLNSLAQRILIIVPETLLHQWLVEMLRRFNLYFSIYDEERCLAIEEGDTENNPFMADQLVLCSLDFLMSSKQRQQQLLAAEWDMLVVDEAHHLQWQPQQVSAEYDLINTLSQQTRAVLLLTATPEQLGKLGHFARLRLLDGDRYPSYEAYLRQETDYEPVANAIAALMQTAQPDASMLQTIHELLDSNDELDNLEALGAHDAATAENARQQLINQLLDRHGTGRVLFRNTRASISGFPQRQLHRAVLTLPDEYHQALTNVRSTTLPHPQYLLSPERLYRQSAGPNDPAWTQIDPRCPWLLTLLNDVAPHRVVVIASNRRSALDISRYLRDSAGLHAAVFHEDLTIIERDRAAAWFADRDNGCQVLVCSEIGSEGRNFQFAHHLVLFDLPMNPDLLEQRIGRLDRIGQQHTIMIHVPVLNGSAQEIMYAFYDRGLQAFQQPCPAGQAVFNRLRPTLLEAMHQLDTDEAALSDLVASAATMHSEINQQLEHGRNRLLEYNSCRQPCADALVDQVRREEQVPTLLSYLDTLFDCYGIEFEDHSHDCYIARPGEQMQAEHFPGLGDDGMTFTCERDTALANEALAFITWDHPLVTGSFDMLLSQELGNATVCAMPCPGVRRGGLLVECCYVLEAGGQQQIQSSRYLPPTTIRVLSDHLGNRHTDHISVEQIDAQYQMVPRANAIKIIQSFTDVIKAMLKANQAQAGEMAESVRQQAAEASQGALQDEIDRLTTLQRHNPNIRPEERGYLIDLQQQLQRQLAACRPRLDALRLIVAT